MCLLGKHSFHVSWLLTPQTKLHPPTIKFCCHHWVSGRWVQSTDVFIQQLLLEHLLGTGPVLIAEETTCQKTSLWTVKSCGNTERQTVQSSTIEYHSVRHLQEAMKDFLCVLASRGFYNKISRSSWLTQQTLTYVSEFWRLEVQVQVANRFSSWWDSVLGYILLHMAERASSGASSSSYKGTNTIMGAPPSWRSHHYTGG